MIYGFHLVLHCLTSFRWYHKEVPAATSRCSATHFFWLVVDLPLWKIWQSVGVIIPNIWKKKHVQTTNQAYLACFFNVLFASQRTNAPHTLSAWRSQSPHLRLADLPATWDTCAMADLKDGNINRELSVVNQKNNDPHSYGDGSKPW